VLQIERGATIIAGDGKTKGSATGGGYHCRLEGCRGWRIGVRWADGDITFPCSKGMILVGEDRIAEGRIIT